MAATLDNDKKALKRECTQAEAEAVRQKKRAEIAQRVAEAQQREAEAKRLQEEARQRDLCGAKTSAPVDADRVDDVTDVSQAKASPAEQRPKAEPTEEEIMLEKLRSLNRGINQGSRRKKQTSS